MLVSALKKIKRHEKRGFGFENRLSCPEAKWELPPSCQHLKPRDPLPKFHWFQPNIWLFHANPAEVSFQLNWQLCLSFIILNIESIFEMIASHTTSPSINMYLFVNQQPITPQLLSPQPPWSSRPLHLRKIWAKRVNSHFWKSQEMVRLMLC